MATIQDQVRAFHAAMGVETRKTPGIPSDDEVRLRLRLIAEEFFETLQACGMWCWPMKVAHWFLFMCVGVRRVRVHLPAFADGLADLAYVTESAAQAFGIDSAGVLAEVQRANMAKAGGGRRADGKIVKPAGWTPPDIAGVLDAQGWKR